MTAALRIGLVTPAWPGHRTANGIATVVTHIAAGLEACGHEVTIIALAADGPPGAARVVAVPAPAPGLLDRLRLRLRPGDGSVLHRLHGLRIAAAVTEAVRRHGIEVVVMEETFGWAGTVRDAVAIPVVATLHGPWWLHTAVEGSGNAREDAWREAREAAALRRVDGITAPSRDVLERTRTLWGLPDVPQAVIPNPMPVGQAAAGPPPGPADPERLLFVGRFDRIKGGDVVIEAFARLAPLHPGCRLTFVGPDRGIGLPGGGRLFLQEAVARLPAAVRARIDILGPRSREEVAALRGAHGIAIVASRYETFGGTMAEAMAAGSALVCTRVGGCPEMLSDGETGLLVPPEDPGAIAAACLRLLQDPPLAARLGAAARQHIAATLDPAAIGRQMAAFLAPICRR
ncbi:MAG TPA: glycosyltransferase family 4 protein [Paracoccaceae bacterium]|nr:glycosyltransferase family 4 protein [Paracoccaceae bacterium]